ncbi:organomercurial lyase [Paraburkholderia sp. PGU19]|uniref:organomercurial lyase n=1 Tax=Paraburkholderia sp. PGU19 TaxID=2735434 RepID=UPI0015DA9EE0|nr:organomercurial lyase [Paraburkholderia sp. PGU19]
MNQQRFDSLLHHHIVMTFIQKGHAPTNEELAQKLAASLDEVESGLVRLGTSHGIVLHPGRCELWVVHPFSSSPTHTWVQAATSGWWAPCMWCALGIAALIKGELTIHTRIGAEKEPVQIDVVDGVPEQAGLFVHFADPPRKAWDNVHHFCARVLPFRSPEDVADWAKRHRLPLGEVMPITLLGELARRWYSHHADADWEKWTPAQALEIFQSIGLVSDFWNLDTSAKHY